MPTRLESGLNLFAGICKKAQDPMSGANNWLEGEVMTRFFQAA